MVLPRDVVLPRDLGHGPVALPRGIQQLVGATEQIRARLCMCGQNARRVAGLEPAVAMLTHDLSA